MRQGGRSRPIPSPRGYDVAAEHGYPRLVLAQTAPQSSAVTAIVGSVVLLGMSGPALHQSAEHGDEHAIHWAVVACFVVATLLSVVSPPRDSKRRHAKGASEVQPDDLPRPADSRPQPRASPGWLQRFRI